MALPIVPRRAVVFLLVFSGMTCLSGSLNTMGFAITCMASQRENRSLASADCGCECTIRVEPDLTEMGYSMEYDWSTHIQGLVLAASSWGCLALSFFSWLPDKYSEKWIYAFCAAWTAVLNFVCPVSTKLVALLIPVRILTGVGPAFSWSLFMKVVDRWAPKTEIAIIIGIVSTGNVAGVLLNVLISGKLCQSVGWQYIFYFWGIMCSMWTIIWCVLYSDQPCNSIMMPDRRELELIAKDKCKTAQKAKIPWKHVLSSPHMWILFYMGICGNTYSFFVFDYAPTYLKTVLMLPSELDGLVSALPLLMTVIGRSCIGFISNVTRLSLTVSLKLFTFLGMVIPALLLVAISFFNCSQVPAAITCLSLASLFSSCSTAGYVRAPPYLAPAFVSTVSMFAQVSSAVAGTLLPLVLPAMLPTYSVAEWRHVFLFVASVMVSGGVLYALLGTSEEQYWGSGVQKITANNSRRPESTQHNDHGDVKEISVESLHMDACA